jgi:alkyl hydroperoxide reductase 1
MDRGSWGRTLGFKDKIVALSDPEAAWAKQLGLAIDLTGGGMGWRTGRFFMILDDLKVVKTEVEPNGTFHS